MASPNTVTYNAGRAGTAVLQHPTITVAHATEVSAYRQFTVLVRITYTIRAIVVTTDADALKNILETYRTVLNVSGGTFQAHYVGNYNFLSASPETDITGGPHPIFFEARELHGGRSAQITWTLQTEKHVKDDSVNAVGTWLDFVYTVNTSLNANFYATRVISGVLRLSSCHQQTRYRSADAFRTTVEVNIAPVPATGVWQRVSREYRLSEDRKILAFTITDQQLYTPLPYGLTSGDMTLTVISERYGEGRFILRGWFESSPNVARGAVQSVVKELWQLFFNLVVKRIESETAGDDAWFIENERRSYNVHWRSNRVEFEAEYQVLGEFERDIPDNIEYTVSRALDWLAYLSRRYNRATVDLGPHGSAPVLGPTGKEAPGPVILLDPMEKLPAGFAYGPDVSQPYTGGDRTHSIQGTAGQKAYITWHNRFEYKLDLGRVFIPVKQSNLCDVTQQVRNPSLYLIVAGEAERVGGSPEIPIYPYTKLATAVSDDTFTGTKQPQIILVDTEIVTHEPTPNSVYRVTWKQLYKFHNIAQQLPFRWPATPLNEELGGEELDTIPELL